MTSTSMPQTNDAAHGASMTTRAHLKDEVAFFSTACVNRPYDLQGAIGRVLNSQHFILGREVSAFESEFAHYCGTRHAIGVGNGTDALELSLRAVGMGPKKNVATVANAGFYTSSAALAVGAMPIYVDVCEKRRTMCPKDLERLLSEQSCHCIVVTHLFGQLADIDGIKHIADRYSIPLVEDCAQAHGAARNGVKAGATGLVSAFSFYPTKNLGAVGDGGAVVTSNDTVAQALRSLRQYGWSTKYQVDVPGGKNSRLDEMQAAVLRLKLPDLDGANQKRIDIATRYNQAFSDLPLGCPSILEQENVSHLYVVTTKNRENVQRALKLRGIQTAVHYPVLDCSQAILESSSKRHLPNTQALLHSIVSLPCYPGMPDSDVERVIAAVRDYHANGALHV